MDRRRRHTGAAVELPADVGPFVGRDAEAAEALDLLESHRVVSVEGPGGAGKTRLAVHTAWRWHERTQQPAAFVELAPATDLGSIVARLAAACRVDISGRGGLDDALARIAVGFSVPTTDVARMRAFLERELDRR